MNAVRARVLEDMNPYLDFAKHKDLIAITVGADYFTYDCENDRELEADFDEVIVAVLQNNAKKTSFFTIDERLNIIKEIYGNNPKIKVVTGNGAAVDVAIENNCKAIVRGLRGLSDYDYEVRIANINKDISNNAINTVCLFADTEYQFVSSSVVKEVFNLNKDISKYVHPIVKQKMIEKRDEKI